MIKKIESDDVSISYVLAAFNHIKDSIDIQDLGQLTTKAEIINLVKSRKKFIIKPVHYLANLIDPKHYGIDLSDEEKFEGEKCLEDLINNMELSEDDKEEVFKTFSCFKTKSGFFNLERIWASKIENSIEWWNEFNFYKSYKWFAKIASRILSICATSASVERVFSKHGRIHSKDRNGLLNSRIERILAIQTYYQSFHRKNKQINNSETESQYES